MKNNIILIGFMGCGKSTIGKHLSRSLKRSFMDTDREIEEKEKTTISEIFAAKGEAYFRELETAFLKELAEKKGEEKIENRVISVGGGLPLKEENQKLLRQLGEVIYLKASAATIYERVKGDKNRPLLQTENPEEKIKEMMEQRKEKYEKCAHKVIAVDGKTIPEIIEEIQALPQRTY